MLIQRVFRHFILWREAISFISWLLDLPAFNVGLQVCSMIVKCILGKAGKAQESVKLKRSSSLCNTRLKQWSWTELFSASWQFNQTARLLNLDNSEEKLKLSWTLLLYSNCSKVLGECLFILVPLPSLLFISIAWKAVWGWRLRQQCKSLDSLLGVWWLEFCCTWGWPSAFFYNPVALKPF